MIQDNFTTQLIRKAHPSLGGYAIAVRDNWTYRIKKLHLSDDQAQRYAEAFGGKIIFEDQFYQWLKTIMADLQSSMSSTKISKLALN